MIGCSVSFLPLPGCCFSRRHEGKTQTDTPTRAGRSFAFSVVLSQLVVILAQTAEPPFQRAVYLRGCETGGTLRPTLLSLVKRQGTLESIPLRGEERAALTVRQASDCSEEGAGRGGRDPV